MTPRVTVLTPSYQRATTLPRLYRSLLEQDGADFEWMVVDDGSEDGTDALVRSWIAEGSLPIEYVWQPNGGKHAAVNRGVARARGEFCALIDSDDWYKPGALAAMLECWDSIPAARYGDFADVEGRRVDADERPVGDPFPGDPFDSNAFEIAALHGVRGDSIGMYRTEVLRRFPFPEDLGWHVTPSLVWNRVAARFQTRYTNAVWAYTDYQATGLSARDTELRLRFPAAQLAYWSEYAAMPRPMKARSRYRANANRVRYMLLTGAPFRALVGASPTPLWALAALPAGAYLHWRDRRLSAGLDAGREAS